mmetsp:Transcript_140782/g.450043  ORF Transcript_140782/g.450043 Transcript_140782/m.450043 type:complete len:214 (+) Transcript_140782:356-997(+)
MTTSSRALDRASCHNSRLRHSARSCHSTWLESGSEPATRPASCRVCRRTSATHRIVPRPHRARLRKTNWSESTAAGSAAATRCRAPEPGNGAAQKTRPGSEPLCQQTYPAAPTSQQRPVVGRPLVPVASAAAAAAAAAVIYHGPHWPKSALAQAPRPAPEPLHQQTTARHPSAPKHQQKVLGAVRRFGQAASAVAAAPAASATLQSDLKHRQC